MLGLFCPSDPGKAHARVDNSFCLSAQGALQCRWPRSQGELAALGASQFHQSQQERRLLHFLLFLGDDVLGVDAFPHLIQTASQGSLVGASLR